MIAYVKGKLVEKTPTYAVVEAGGIGFRLWMPLSSYDKIGEVGQDVRLHSWLHVRDDAMDLFGFATEPEREMFLMLISVSGIGPRTAQGILSGVSVAEMKRAIREHDMQTLTSAPGIGKKTAERIVVELREKVGEAFQTGRDAAPASVMSGVGEEAVLALMTLGYKRSNAENIIRQQLLKNPSPGLESLVKEALRRISKG